MRPIFFTLSKRNYEYIETVVRTVKKVAIKFLQTVNRAFHAQVQITQ